MRMTNQVCSRVSYSFLTRMICFGIVFGRFLPWQLTDFWDHIFDTTATRWPLGKRSLTGQITFPSILFMIAQLKYVFAQYFCFLRYCFVLFCVSYLALTSWAQFWSPVQCTRLSIRACHIDCVFYALGYSLKPSLSCYVGWGWAGLIAGHLKLLAWEAILSELHQPRPHSNVGPECTHE